ncbi:MAG: DUF86 domain-containing protein [bacterium]
MSRRDPKVRLLHMRDHAEKAVGMAEGHVREDLDKDEKLKFALIHLVEVIGEAASQVPLETREQYPEIPWPQIVGMRHHLVHEYDAVDLNILWETINRSLPELLEKLNKIINELT